MAMADKIKKTYVTLLIPSLVGFFLIFFFKTNNFVPFDKLTFPEVFAPLVFILSVVFAVALPIFLRALFAHKMRYHHRVSEKDFIQFERSLIQVALVAPYLALIAYMFDFPRFYYIGTILTTLYATYYFYPSKRRIRFEQRLFRVTCTNDSD